MSEIEVYKIVNESGGFEGVYSRAYHDEYEFNSVQDARSANCHGVHKDRAKYKIAKYKVTYELINNDCDPATQEEIDEYEADKAFDARVKKEIKEKGLSGGESMAYIIDQHVLRSLIEGDL